MFCTEWPSSGLHVSPVNSNRCCHVQSVSTTEWCTYLFYLSLMHHLIRRIKWLSNGRAFVSRGRWRTVTYVRNIAVRHKRAFRCRSGELMSRFGGCRKSWYTEEACFWKEQSDVWFRAVVLKRLTMYWVWDAPINAGGQISLRRRWIRTPPTLYCHPGYLHYIETLRKLRTLFWICVLLLPE